MSPRDEPFAPGSILLITGIPAAGKSTVAQLLAERRGRSVHVRGDLFRRLVVNGRRDMLPERNDDAIAQLHLRYRLGAMAADAYAEAGFSVVYQDVFMEGDLATQVGRIRTRRLSVVSLLPMIAVVERREATRVKTAYDPWTVGALDAALRDRTPRIGLWLDTSLQTPEETVDEILARADEAIIR